MNERYDKLNKLLESVYFRFINDNKDLIDNAIQESINNFGNGSFEIVEHFDQEVKKEDVIDITKSFLKYIDSSGEILKFFDDCLDSNKIYLWNFSDREFIINKYFDMGIIDDSNVVDLCFCCRWPRTIINLPLSGSVTRDVVSLVHEFMHLFCFKLHNLTISYLNEMVAIYFENRAANWLVSNGYNKEEAFSTLNLRNHCDGINNVVSIGGISIMKLIDLFRIKNRDGVISEDNIVSDFELFFLKGNDYLLEVMDLMVKGEKLSKLDIEEERLLKSKYVCSLIESISSLFDFSNGYFDKIINYISYCLGTYISNRFEDCNLDSKMLYIARNMYLVDDFVLIKVLDGDIDIKCKGIKKNV